MVFVDDLDYMLLGRSPYLGLLSHLKNSRTMSLPDGRPHSPTTPPSGTESGYKRRRLSNSVMAKDIPSSSPIASTSALPYGRGLHLAPMVRIGTLPTRLTALEHGAELVWGPEIVDKAMLHATRSIDAKTGTVRFMINDKSIYDCHPIEKSRLIFQLGSADPDLAVQAALMVAGDVAGIGLNCGCPKPFSTTGGMGAALLTEPDKLCNILRNLVDRVPLPIDVKIRLLPSQEETIDLVKKIIQTGISALTVHCRTKNMRSSEPALLHRLKDIVEVVKPSGIPVIANGDCLGAMDQERICDLTGVSSIMIARAAEANPSCFSKSGLKDQMTELMPQYVRLAIVSGNAFHNTKYNLLAMNPSCPPRLSRKERGELRLAITKAKTYTEYCDLLGIEDEENIIAAGIEKYLPNWTDRRISGAPGTGLGEASGLGEAEQIGAENQTEDVAAVGANDARSK